MLYRITLTLIQVNVNELRWDLDNWIYQDSSEKLYKAIYNNNPNSIEDIEYYPVNKQSYEHPFEKMAIYIENI